MPHLRANPRIRFAAGRSRPQATRWRRAAALLLAILAGYIALHIHRWGQPVPPVFHPAGEHRWRADDGRQIQAADLDGDGVYDRFSQASGFFARPTAATAGSRLLILCLDGVPYSQMHTLWDQGRFREFFPPVEMVSTFPSDSETALTALLHAATVHGYENEYFDRTQGRVTGGIRVTLEQSSSYLKKLDYDEPAIFKGTHFVVSRKSFRADLGRLRKRFLASRAPVYVAHISSTDALYHVLPSGEVLALLEEMEALLRDLYFEAEGRLRIMMFSDHGNDLLPGQPAPLRESLEQAGFRVKNRLDEPRAVVIPEFGLVSFAAVYVDPAVVPEVARVLAVVEGVAAVVYRDGDAVRVQSRTGEATIQARAGTGTVHFLYRAERGDPLRLLPLWKQLEETGKLDSAGFAPEEELFSATLNGPYPDALFRLWYSMQDPPQGLVENRADLLVSLADGYYFGRGWFEHFVTLQSTHGGLSRRASLGFAMSTDAPFPRAVRYNELLQPPHKADAAKSNPPELPVFPLPR